MAYPTVRPLILGVAAATAGCCTSNADRLCAYRTPVPGQDLVLVANGSGDFQTVTAGLSGAVEVTGAPLRVETFDWSHGFGRYVVDHVDHVNHVEQGRRLACVVTAQRQACPGQAVYLIAHSAGSAVVLAAAEALPLGSLERIVLLSASVSSDYDLRPALACARQGIDSFSSRRDVFTLGVAMALVGTADRCSIEAAGRVGFRPVGTSPADVALYAKLRQHAWDPSVSWTGDDGLHYGNNREEFIQAYVLPLLVRAHGPPAR